MSLRRLKDAFVRRGALAPLGAMHDEVTFLLPVRNADGSYDDPTPFATTWAAVTALSGRQLEKAQQIDAEVSHLVVIPYVAGLSDGMVILYGARTFDTSYIIDPTENQVQLNIYCTERGQNP